MFSSSVLKSRRVSLQYIPIPVAGGAPPAPADDEPASLPLAEFGPLEREPEPPAAPDPAAELDAAREQARAEGLAQGRDEGLAGAAAETEELLAAARAMLAEVTEWKRQQLAAEVPNVVGLALGIAERIVRRAVDVDADLVVRTLEEAARQREAKDLVRIAVNPEQVELIREHWARAHPGQAEVAIGADPGIEPGGCLLFSESSLIDAQLQTQLDVIARALQERQV